MLTNEFLVGWAMNVFVLHINVWINQCAELKEKKQRQQQKQQVELQQQ